MTGVLLCAPSAFDLRPVRAALERLDLDAAATALEPRAWDTDAARSAAKVALIVPDGGVVTIGEQAARVREDLGDGVPLLVCCPRLTAGDRRTLIACGATAALSPRSWDANAVAERILAELIVAGDVRPAASGKLRGASEVMRALYKHIETLAPLDEAVLILGETGTGKELVAGELHRRSGRPGDVMAINCAALAPELLESELFGHERGAFSGAVSSREGLLIDAGKGTVFLDEIGDLPLAAQAKLLRVLEEKRVRPVGSNQWHKIDARVLLATNCDLDEACRERRFRQDLYERLRAFVVRLPPLRARRADLPLLAHHFVEQYNAAYSGQRHIPPGALDPLFLHEWPGNVRELHHALWQAAAYAAGPDAPISVLQLLEAMQRGPARSERSGLSFDPASETWHDVQQRARAAYFRAVLQQTGGNKDAAAKRAGMSRSQFYEVLKTIEESSSQGERG